MNCKHHCQRCGQDWEHDSGSPAPCALPEDCLCDLCFYGSKRLKAKKQAEELEHKLEEIP
jgi:hypothetical protein